MTDFKQETKAYTSISSSSSSSSSSSTSMPAEPVVVIPPPSRHALGDQEENDSLPFNHATLNNSSPKPDLKFSIERILGLNSRSRTELTSYPVASPREKPPQGILGNFYVGAESRLPPDDDDDDDEEDDDEEDSESIDVDDPSVTENSERDIFMAAYSNFAVDGDTPKYQWLQCTRYHPPKIQRSKKKEGTKRRKLGRNPRVPFTQHQVSVLEDKFRRTHYLSSMDVAELSSTLNLTETRVKIWFQNRRARERRDKEASQRNQVPLVTKANSFQPLTIPSVAWPINASLAPTSYAQLQGAINYHQSYLSSGFSFFNGVRDGHDIHPPSAYTEKRPGTNDNVSRQLIKFQ